MAKKPTKKRTSSPSTPKSETHITRVKAGEVEKPSAVKQALSAAKSTRANGKKTPKRQKAAAEPRRESSRRRNPLAALIGYFKGSWYELKQVRWPDRRSTWGMTGALLLFTAFFVLFIILIDTLFRQLFQLIIG